VKASHSIRPVFDDPNLVSTAGLVPTLRLAETAGLHDLLEQRLTVASPNPAAKATCVIGGMLAGADSIDDLDLLRHGAMDRLFDGLRAPSTLGTYLRSFTHGHVQQLDAVGTRVLAGLTAQVPGLIAGAQEPDGLALIDVDDTIREVHGYAKQGAAYGYSKVRGLNAQLAVLSTPLAAPVILGARLRSGNTASATGTARLLAQGITTARTAGVRARILARADSAYYGQAFVGTALRHGVWFSVTARMTATVKTAIASIEDQAWETIKYPNAVFDDQEQRWISDAEVAEVPFTAFTGRRKADHVTCRLVVRRIKRLQRLASDGTEQGELFATYRHHAFITNSTLGLVEADQTHREHAIIEQVIAELKDGALAHLPSGKYTANAAWLSHAVIAFNIARAAAVATGAPKIRWATLREQIIRTPARVASTSRRLILHLPRDWPWTSHWQSLWDTATQPLTT
jgi:hypothetical protein